MIGTLFAGAIISLLIAAVTAYLLLRFVRQEIERIHSQQHNQWQAQEAQFQLWRSSQEKRLSDLEYQVSAQIQKLQAAQKAREEAEDKRFNELIRQYETITTKARMEHEFSQLPRLEDVPLPDPDHQQQHGFTAQRTPPNFQGSDLSGRDLSSRYLSHADLRQAKLARAKLFMVDLSWANLADADLSEAELSAANLTYANLRGATLRGANFLVADLNHAILIGADLRNAHSLSLEQVSTTLYDATTLFDPELASKLPQKARTYQPIETGRKSEDAFENTNHIPVPPRNQQLQAAAQPELPAPTEQEQVLLPSTEHEPQARTEQVTEQVLQTPTGEVLPLEQAVPPVYQTPLEIPSSLDDVLSHPSQETSVTFPENSDTH